MCVCVCEGLHDDGGVTVCVCVPVVSEEDEVSLVVEGEHPPPLELWDLREPRGQHPCHTVTQPRREVVQDHLRLVLRHLPMTL